MRSVHLRLFLLVCVAAMLRPDAAQAQTLAYLTPTEFAAALLIHFGAENGTEPDSTSAPARQNVARPARPFQTWPAPSVTLPPSRTDTRASAPHSGHTRFKARSNLPADAEPALA